MLFFFFFFLLFICFFDILSTMIPRRVVVGRRLWPE